MGFTDKKFKFKHVILFSCAGLLVGSVITLFFSHRNSEIPQLTRIHSASSHYTYVNPSLTVDVGDKKQFTEYKPLESDVDKYIASKISDGTLTDASLYFRDLESGNWTGVNETDQFSPGSLLKIPIMIAYLKKAESDPNFLKTSLKYQSAVDANNMENIKPAKAIQSGNSYSIDDLLTYMIVYSDNNATNLLYDNIDLNSLNDLYSDLGINYGEDKTSTDFVSTKQYSLFFRILYSATYLNSDMSEKALKLLSQVDFKEGIVAGLPANTTVAHKFGERVFNINGVDAVKELHDCGVVYYPDHPYIACIMTKGKDFTEEQKVIADISRLVFNSVTSDYKSSK